MSTPAPPTPVMLTGPLKKHPTRLIGKRDRDVVVLPREGPLVPANVKYWPFEPSEWPSGWTREQRRNLATMHGAGPTGFKLYNLGESDGLIQDFSKFVPYKCDKKDFFSKTGKTGFHVFGYTFEFVGQTHTVLWDYMDGMVRITPFFKALNLGKTQPNNALKKNAGLHDLVSSITGGSVSAQGYWMPYDCARAVCATFCFDIRWALTPVFGPSFVTDCRDKNAPNFVSDRFSIDGRLVRAARHELETLCNANMASRRDTPLSDTPRSHHGQRRQDQHTVTSAPRQESTMPATRTLRSSNAQPAYTTPDSPTTGDEVMDVTSVHDSDDYSEEERTSRRHGRHHSSRGISPKTVKHSAALPSPTSTNTFTPINGSHRFQTPSVNSHAYESDSSPTHFHTPIYSSKSHGKKRKPAATSSVRTGKRPATTMPDSDEDVFTIPTHVAKKPKTRDPESFLYRADEFRGALVLMQMKHDTRVFQE